MWQALPPSAAKAWAAALAAIGATCALALPTLAHDNQGPVEEAPPESQPAMGDGDLREPLLAGEAEADDVGIA